MTLNNRTNRVNCSCDRITVIIHLKEVTECLCLYVSSPQLRRTHQPVFVWAVLSHTSLLQFSFCSAFNWNPVDMSHVTVLLAHPIVRPSTVNFDVFLHLWFGTWYIPTFSLGYSRAYTPLFSTPTWFNLLSMFTSASFYGCAINILILILLFSI